MTFRGLIKLLHQALQLCLSTYLVDSKRKSLKQLTLGWFYVINFIIRTWTKLIIVISRSHATCNIADEADDKCRNSKHQDRYPWTFTDNSLSATSIKSLKHHLTSDTDDISPLYLTKKYSHIYFGLCGSTAFTI